MPNIPVVSFTTSYNGRSNVLINQALISRAFDPSRTKNPPKNPKKFNAIWDTGATASVITRKVAEECGLKSIGIAKVFTAGGEHRSPVYLISLFLPNKVVIPQLRVTEGVLPGDAEVLIGMDIIGQGDFAVTNKDGKTTFSFRMPSIERIDFVKQKPIPTSPVKRASPKIGRNDPCPCGSGLKFKKCCGK